MNENRHCGWGNRWRQEIAIFHFFYFFIFFHPDPDPDPDLQKMRVKDVAGSLTQLGKLPALQGVLVELFVVVDREEH